MKSSAVNLAANIFANGTESLAKTAMAEETAVFSTFMDRANQEQNVSVNTEVKAPEKAEVEQQETEVPEEMKDVKETEETATEQQETVKEVEKEEQAEGLKANESEDGQDMTEEESLLLGNFVQEIQALFMEKFQITEEEFVNLMETMDIRFEDLTNPSVLTDMVKALGNAEDAMALLVDEELYANCMDIIKEVAAMQESLLEQMGITPEDLEQMLSKFWEQQNVVPEDTLEEGLATGILDEVVDMPERADQIPVDSADEEIQTGLHKLEDGQTVETTTADSDIVEEDSTISGKEISTNDRENGSRNETNGQTNHGFDFVNQLKENVNMNVQTLGTEFLASETDYETIIRQISEQIRIHVTEDISSMEMNLNPESLGKVVMQIELKQGALTAQFSVENEQVKEAMESQIAQLREDFDKQGLKVESIEVTVEAHEFEQNLMQGEGNGNQTQQENTKANRAFRSGLEELAEEADFLSDEELAEKMMKEDGTTLNYLA